MSSSKLDQFRGFLTTGQVAAGMTCANQNARRLAEDAQLLFDSRRFPTATALAVLSLEELGKCAILRQIAVATTVAEVKKLWQRYRRHTEKHILTLMPDRILKGAQHAIEFLDCVADTGHEERATYDNLKQISLYTDCLGSAHWSVPAEVIDEDLTRTLVHFADVMSAKYRSITEREIELWVMHMQKGLNHQNLRAWATAMVEEGLHPHGYAEEMAEFTKGLN
jgi:AbiV family abortive infection protein